MPIGTTSKRSRSIAARTLPAETHETACSLLRPPKTMATRSRRASVTGRQYLPVSPRVGADRTDEVGSPHRADPDVRTGVGRLHHLAVSDDHADVVDGVGIAGVRR